MYQCVAGCHFVPGRIYSSDHTITLYNHTICVSYFIFVCCILQDICRVYPCEAGKECIRRGGATCFDANGCDPDDLRLCGEFSHFFAPFLSCTSIACNKI